MENLDLFIEAIERKISRLKIENGDLTNFKLVFNGDTLYLQGELIENGKLVGYYPCYSDKESYELGHFYIPTKKGYISSEWKKTDYYKIGTNQEEDYIVDMNFVKEVFAYWQPKEPSMWLGNASISRATALADFITKTGGDIYCNA